MQTASRIDQDRLERNRLRGGRDVKTGIQALAQLRADKPTTQGLPDRNRVDRIEHDASAKKTGKCDLRTLNRAHDPRRSVGDIAFWLEDIKRRVRSVERADRQTRIVGRVCLSSHCSSTHFKNVIDETPTATNVSD